MLRCGRVWAARTLKMFESLVIHSSSRVNDCCQMCARLAVSDGKPGIIGHARAFNNDDTVSEQDVFTDCLSMWVHCPYQCHTVSFNMHISARLGASLCAGVCPTCRIQ
jgi:hypothetical protein